MSNNITCLKKFCNKTLKNARARILKVNQKTRISLEKKLKELKGKIDIAERNNDEKEKQKLSNTHIFIYETIQGLKETNKLPILNKLIRNSCAKFYCNPGCKGTLMTKKTYNKNLPTDFIEKIQKNGATSACITKLPKEDLF